MLVTARRLSGPFSGYGQALAANGRLQTSRELRSNVAKRNHLAARPAVHTAHGDARRDLRQLAEISADIALLRRKEAQLLHRRDQRILSALGEGVSAAHIARVTEMNPARVRQIKGAAIQAGLLRVSAVVSGPGRGLVRP